MILNAILTVVKVVLIALMQPFNIPALPGGVYTVLHYEMFTNALASGVSILAAYTHFSFLSGLFLAVMVFHALELLWKWISWVLRKIPIINVRG